MNDGKKSETASASERAEEVFIMVEGSGRGKIESVVGGGRPNLSRGGDFGGDLGGDCFEIELLLPKPLPKPVTSGKRCSIITMS